MENVPQKQTPELIDDTVKAERMAYAEAPHRDLMQNEVEQHLRNPYRLHTLGERALRASTQAALNYEADINPTTARIDDADKAFAMANAAKRSMDGVYNAEQALVRSEDSRDEAHLLPTSTTLMRANFNEAFMIPMRKNKAQNGREKAETQMNSAADKFDKRYNKNR